jgi:hypothetical protein
MVNANLAEYHVPTNADIGIIDVDVVEAARLTNPTYAAELDRPQISIAPRIVAIARAANA